MEKNLLDKFDNEVQGLDIYGKMVIYKGSNDNVFIIGNLHTGFNILSFF